MHQADAAIEYVVHGFCSNTVTTSVQAVLAMA